MTDTLTHTNPKTNAINQLSFERKLLLLSLLPSLPTTVILIILLYQSQVSVYLTTMMGILLMMLVWFCALTINNKTNYLFRTLANLLEALSHGDTSLRGNKTLQNGALGDLIFQINSLSDTLSQQRLEVKEQQLLLAKVIKHIDVAIVAIDQQDNISLTNPAAAKLFNLTMAQLNSKTSQQLALPALVEAANKTQQGSGRGLTQWQFPQRSGRFAIVTDQFIESGHSHRLIFITDVKEMLRHEEQKTWQNLIRVISHEINNSLTPISSLSQTLSRIIERDDRLGDNQIDLIDGLEIIHQRADGLASFINSYRQLTGLPEPKRQRINLQPLLQHIVSLYEHRHIRLDCPATLNVTIDPVQFQQLLINIVKNADEAMTDPSGMIEIRAEIKVASKAELKAPRSAEITAEHKQQQLHITISDQGPGLSNFDNLFTPFYSTKASGSGIGLILCRQIVEAHQGDLTLSNRTDQSGCQVHITVT